MATETLSVAAARRNLSIIRNDRGFRSAAGALQTEGRTGNRWRLVLSFRVSGEKKGALEGHDAFLMGTRNRLRVEMNHAGYKRRGSGGGSPVLSGGHSAGAVEIDIAGAPTSASGILLPGDLFTIDNELKRVSAPVNSNGSGEATISFWPELHKNMGNAEPIEWIEPYGIFFQRTSANFPADPGPILETVFDLEEDVLA